MKHLHKPMIVFGAGLILLLSAPAAAQAPGEGAPGDTAKPDPPAVAPAARPTDKPAARPAGKLPRPPRARPERITEPITAKPPRNPPVDHSKPASQADKKRKKLWKKLTRFLTWFHPSTVWYLQYRYGDQGGDGGEYNEFFVGRGYLTLKFKPTRWFEARMTMDTHQDGEGDWKVRLKYMYAKFKLPIETAVVTEPYVELGIAHIPWLDYEEHINYYRMQGTMFAERNKLHNSADLGITIGTLLGRKLPRKIAKKMGDKYPGSWGSMALGVYNGTGYHDLENNTNKVIEGRVSIRPGGPYFPYVQLSYFFTYGKATRNMVIEDDPATPADEAASYEHPIWQNNIAMLSFAHRYAAVTAQYIFGKGTQKGSQPGWLYQPGESASRGPGTAKTYRGASLFAELRLEWIKSSLWGRYDWWDGPYSGVNLPYHRIIAAYAFHFWGRNQNILMLDFEYLLFDDETDTRENQWALTLSVQVKLK